MRQEHRFLVEASVHRSGKLWNHVEHWMTDKQDHLTGYLSSQVTLVGGEVQSTPRDDVSYPDQFDDDRECDLKGIIERASDE